MDELTMIGGAVAASVTFILGLFGVGVKWLWDKLEPRIDHTVKTLDRYADTLDRLQHVSKETSENQRRIEQRLDQVHTALIVAIEAHKMGASEGGLQMARSVLERRKSRRREDHEKLKELLNDDL